MKYKIKKPPKPRFKAFLFVEDELYELQSLAYHLGTASRTKTKIESTRKLALNQTNIVHCHNLLIEALQKANQEKSQRIEEAIN
ncbi:MAG: hypothetical protein PUP93_27955 [Rhizonema sp. NSF051]|nr:hypothetical protein [Rhizonema sp. NSF051]